MAGRHNSGRHPKPTALHRLHGTRPKRLRRLEPRSAVGCPLVPAHIQTDLLALMAWERHAAALVARKVLTPEHGDLLASLAMVSADLQRTRELMAAMDYRPVVVETAPDAAGKLRTKVRINPVRIVFDRLVEQQTRLLSEFGLTPVSSPKVAALEAVIEDDFTAWERARPSVVAFPTPRTRGRQAG